MRLRLSYACSVVGVILAGLTLRHPGLGLPWPLAKYGGSVLWGAMVFLIVASAVVPRASLSRRTGAAAVVALLVECIRLYHTPWLDTFRATTAGALLLGRHFSLWDIIAYWTGIAGAALGDRAARPRAAPLTSGHGGIG